jgi:hypothetical protein
LILFTEGVAKIGSKPADEVLTRCGTIDRAALSDAPSIDPPVDGLRLDRMTKARKKLLKISKGILLIIFQGIECSTPIAPRYHCPRPTLPMKEHSTIPTEIDTLSKILANLMIQLDS